MNGVGIPKSLENTVDVRGFAHKIPVGIFWETRTIEE